MRRSWPSRAALAIGLLISTALLPVMAAPLSPPEGEVLLKVTGDIEHPNVGNELHLDREQLMSLSTHTIETSTPWTQGVGRFEGPLFRAVLETAGVEGERVRVRSLNEYEVEIPLTDLYDHDVILAAKRDGEAIAVRDLGPVFVLYPFDEKPELLNETIRHRSVWHVGTVHVP